LHWLIYIYDFISAVGVAGEVDRMDYSESNYDEFAGYGERLFSSTTYEEDDAEADQIYQSVDEKMEARRKRARERQMLQEQQTSRSQRPRIADQFADLKRDLASVSASDWESIPEVGDHSLKLKQSRKKESFMPVPDSVLLMQDPSTRNAMANSLDPSQDMLGRSSVLPSGVAGLSEMRNSALTSRLDRISDSVSGQTVVDPKGYLTSLNSVKITSEAEIGDIKKARVLLQSVTTTNPQHGPGWIAAARVEEYASKMVNARKIILEGCEKVSITNTTKRISLHV
jgi:pre-mRNA-processing factor 6